MCCQDIFPLLKLRSNTTSVSQIRMKHKDQLSTRKRFGTSFTRAFCLNKETVTIFIEQFGQIYFKKHLYPEDRMYNVDKMGLSIVQSKISKVIGLKEKTNCSSNVRIKKGYNHNYPKCEIFGSLCPANGNFSLNKHDPFSNENLA